MSLLLRIRDPRDTRAWSEFDAIYRPLLFRFAKSQGLSDADAEDEVQRCMTAIQQIMGDFNYDPRKGRFKSWLRTMINNRCRNHRRSAESHKARLQAIREMHDGVQESPEDIFDRIWMEEHLRQGLRTIRAEVGDAKYRAFEAYVIREEPVREVCEAFDITPAQLYKVKWQLTQLLRAHMSALLSSRSGCLTLADLQTYHSGTMSSVDVERIDRHLERCVVCTRKNERLLGKYDQVCDLLRGLGGDENRNSES